MRILMISDVYFPRVNGVSTSIQTFRRELASLGHATHLIAPAYPAEYPLEPGITRIRSRAVPLDPEDRIMSAGDIRALHASLAAQRYDLVHVQTPFVAHYAGVALAARLGLPCVESYHTFFEEYLFHYVSFLPKRWMRAAARRFSRAQGNSVAALVVPSVAMRDVLAAYGVTSRMQVIPTGIRLTEFAGGDGGRFRSRFGIAADDPVMLFVGRVAHEKNIDFLLRAAQHALADVPDLLLVIAGEGPAEAHLKRLVRKLGIEKSVRFVGYMDRVVELLDCYRAADAFVFASRTETQGLVLLEAMTLGLPVISTAVMGTQEIVGARRGALVPEDNEQDFAAAMVRFVRNPALRARLREDAKAYAKEWHADAMAVKMASLYAGVISANQVHSPVRTEAQNATS